MLRWPMDATRLAWEAAKRTGLVGLPWEETPVGRMMAMNGMPLDDPERIGAVVDFAGVFAVATNISQPAAIALRGDILKKLAEQS